MNKTRLCPRARRPARASAPRARTWRRPRSRRAGERSGTVRPRRPASPRRRRRTTRRLPLPRRASRESSPRGNRRRAKTTTTRSRRSKRLRVVPYKAKSGWS
eukprot:18417-Pelagococcus_subviridis.AAC.2